MVIGISSVEPSYLSLHAGDVESVDLAVSIAISTGCRSIQASYDPFNTSDVQSVDNR